MATTSNDDRPLSPKMLSYVGTLRGAERNAATHALRKLSGCALRHGLPVRLNTELAERLLAELAQAGSTPEGMRTMKSLLRKYARASGEGEDWAIASARYDKRPMTHVLKAAHWRTLRHAAAAVLAEGYPTYDIRLVDRWLRHRAGCPARLSHDDVRRFRTCPMVLRKLLKTLDLLDPGNRDNRVMAEALGDLARTGPAPRRVPDWNGLPAVLRQQLSSLANSGLKGTSRASLDAMASTLRRVMKAAAARGLAPEVTHASAVAFAEDLDADGTLTATSKKAYLDFLERFTRLAGYPPALVADIRATMAVYRVPATREVRRKEIALAARPLDLVEVACRAYDLLERAPMIPHAATRRLTYVVAGALALLSKLPIRSLDLRKGRLGHEFRRDGEGWRVDLLTSKTGVPIRGRLAPELTRYLDEVLL